MLAEDSYLMRDGICASLALDDGLDLVAACGSYDELRAAVERFRPDVAPTDIRGWVASAPATSSSWTESLAHDLEIVIES